MFGDLQRTLVAGSTLVGVLMLSGCATSRTAGSSITRTSGADPQPQLVVQPVPEARQNSSADSEPAATTQLVTHQVALDEHQVGSLIAPPVLGTETGVYAIGDLEAMAMSSNPTLQQALAQVQAAEGAALQAGLFPNPVVGYEGEFAQIGGSPNEKWNGGFVSQEFVTGGKLELSRSKWCQRVQIARTNLQAQQQRVINDVRAQFYRTLAAQEQVAIQREVVANGEDNLQTHREMLNVGQTNQSGLLTAEVDLQRDRLSLNQAEQELQHAWRTLTALTGSPELPLATLAGSVAPQEAPLDWDSAVMQLLSSSPELVAARQTIQHDRITVQREEAEPIPNVLLDVTTIQSPVADTTQTTLNVGLPLPIFDRNQGTVQQAQADLMQSHAEARRLELELRTRLATQFRDYQTAWQRVIDYDSKMLPQAKQAYDLLHESYKARRAAWPDVLTAQRRYLMLRSEQIDNAMMFRQADVAVRGMLLTGGLTMPPAPIGAGHIDAVAKPR